MYGDEVSDRVVVPFPLAGTKVQVEGADIEFSDDWDGDSANNTMIWVPSLRCGLHWQARMLFPDACSDKLAKLPGIFHAPSGGFDGESAQ